MSHQTIDARTIETGERQRKDFKEKDLQDLAKSIMKVGLIHAPVITEEVTLVAGERRLRALKLTAGHSFLYGNQEYEYPFVPAHCITRATPELLFEIELEENLRRVNLTPMEEANALAKLHQVRLVENPQQTRKDTAKEAAELAGKESTARDESKVADAIIVDQFQDDPEVQKAAKISISKAAKVAKKKMEVELLHALSGYDKESSSSSMFTVYPGDCLEIMSSFEDHSFDILLFDPPYGIGADKFGEQAADVGHQYEDTKEYADELIECILRAGQELLKPESHVLMFCAFERFNDYVSTYQRLGYSVWPRPLIWSKGQQAHAPIPDYGPRYSYECILFACRGRRKISRLINDVLIYNPVRDKIHAAEKPASLLGALLEFVARPGDRILDPTVGSGSIFEAARGKEAK
jgi:ParB-like chromosome segregation protein Spo0J